MEAGHNMMRKLTELFLILACIAAMAGCGSNKDFDIKIVIPAGSQDEFVFSDEEISPIKGKITISSGEGLGDTEVVLKKTDGEDENSYEPTYLTPGMPIEMEAEKGAWFKVGVSIQNPAEEDVVVSVHVENVTVRIE